MYHKNTQIPLNLFYKNFRGVMLKKISRAKFGLSGEITIPADKSISHRAVMFASLAKGKTLIKNFSKGQDPHSTLGLFKNLGVDAHFFDETSLLITSKGKFVSPLTSLNCGNSGTTMRLVSGILAGQDFNSVLIGDESLSKRPMKRIILPLRLMGAEISSDENHAPISIKGRPLHSIDYNSQIASAQVKSCILLAGLQADGTTTVSEPYLSRNHSELMLKYLEADIKTEDLRVSIKRSELAAKNIQICGDISSAAYFIVAGLIVPNSDIILKNVGLNPTRTGILEVVSKMGGQVDILDMKTVSGELTGDLRIRYSELKGCEISKDLIPRLIDELPVIAVLATQAEGETVIRDAKDLRNKESDRITATVTELQKLGADIQELDDGFIINGKTELSGDCQLETYSDHRLAMSFFVAGLIAKKDITVNGFEWAGISFPEFEYAFSKIIK